MVDILMSPIYCLDIDMLLIVCHFKHQTCTSQQVCTSLLYCKDQKIVSEIWVIRSLEITWQSKHVGLSLKLVYFQRLTLLLYLIAAVTWKLDMLNSCAFCVQTAPTSKILYQCRYRDVCRISYINLVTTLWPSSVVACRFPLTR